VELSDRAFVSFADSAAVATTIFSTPDASSCEAKLSSAPARLACTHVPSINIFRAHLARQRQPDGSEIVDAEGVVSKACYENWLNTRGPTGADMMNPERVFQRTLTGCLTAADGRRPFDDIEEAAILRTIRLKRIWYIFVLLHASTHAASTGPCSRELALQLAPG